MTNNQHTTRRSAKEVAENSDFESSGHKTILTDGGTPTVTRTADADAVVSRETRDGDEIEMLRVPISSTRPDREGDRFTKSALEDMADQIRSDQPLVFDDHGGGLLGPGYSARESIGTQMDAEVEEADDGEHELYAFINPDGTHEEGQRMLSQVHDENQAIKFSVGFRILGYNERTEVEEDYEGEGREFTASDLMETSRVGIPANADASVSMAAKDDGRYVRASESANGIPVILPGGQVSRSGLIEDAANAGFAAKGGTPGESKGECEADSECPDGEECVEGECVPVDDDADEDESASAELAALREEVRELRQELKEDDEDDDEDGEDDDEDEDDDDDDEEESSSDLPPGLKDLVDGDPSEEKLAEVESAIREYRDATQSSGRGSPETGDTSTRDASDLPTNGRSEESPSGEDGETDSAETDSGKTAFEIARGN